jgi:hypothetical protein
MHGVKLKRRYRLIERKSSYAIEATRPAYSGVFSPPTPNSQCRRLKEVALAISMSRSFSSVVEPPQPLQICIGAGRKEVALLRVHLVREAQHWLPVD